MIPYLLWSCCLALGKIPYTCLCTHLYPLTSNSETLRKYLIHRDIVDFGTIKIKMFDEKFLYERKRKQPQKTSYDPSFLVSMVTVEVLSIYTSRQDKEHFTTCRDTIYTFCPKCYSLLLYELLLWWKSWNDTQDQWSLMRMSVNLWVERTDQKHFLPFQLVIFQPHVVHCW